MSTEQEQTRQELLALIYKLTETHDRLTRLKEVAAVKLGCQPVPHREAEIKREESLTSESLLAAYEMFRSCVRVYLEVEEQQVTGS